MRLSIAVFLMAVGLILFPCFPGSAMAYFPPLPAALDALESDADVTVTQVTVPEWEAGSNFYYSFEPTAGETTIGFIIYPGAYVDVRSYAPFAHEIARDGFLTVIVKMIDDLAIGESAERATRVISDYPQIEKWAIGGHSMGAFAACGYTKNHPAAIDGVILWAGYPSPFARINDKIVKAVSIYGTYDGICTLDEIEDSRQDLPPYTRWVPIAGGNHTQFGWYDTTPDPVQPGDNTAGITRQEQLDIVVQATVVFLNHFNLCPDDPANDYDDDSVCPDSDNCAVPNGPTLGTCVKPVSGVHSTAGTICSDNDDCVVALGEICDLGQGDGNSNGCGDACECYADIAATFGKVDLNDLVIMKGEFIKPCPPSPCTADLNGDNKVDLNDLVLMKREFNRTGCPGCL